MNTSKYFNMLAKGLAPSTIRLQVGRSTIELRQRVFKYILCYISKITGGFMIPPIKIQIAGNNCWCCTEDNDPKEFRIVYRADKNIFVAVPHSQEVPMSAIVATREALNVILQENYFVKLDEVHITSTPNSPLSLKQVQTIEGLAAQRLKHVSSDSL